MKLGAGQAGPPTADRWDGGTPAVANEPAPEALMDPTVLGAQRDGPRVLSAPEKGFLDGHLTTSGHAPRSMRDLSLSLAAFGPGKDDQPANSTYRKERARPGCSVDRAGAVRAGDLSMALASTYYDYCLMVSEPRGESGKLGIVLP